MAKCLGMIVTKQNYIQSEEQTKFGECLLSLNSECGVFLSLV